MNQMEYIKYSTARYENLSQTIGDVDGNEYDFLMKLFVFSSNSIVTRVTSYVQHVKFLSFIRTTVTVK